MRTAPVVRISRNDPSHAHAAARAALTSETFLNRIKKFHAANRRRTGVLRALRKTLGEHILLELIAREKGSREKWAAVLRGVSTEGTIEAVTLVFLRGRLFDPFGGIVTAHALARVFQRTLRSNDLTAALEIIDPVIRALCEFALENQDSAAGPLRRFCVATPRGVALGEFGQMSFIVKTWIDVETLMDPAKRAACAKAAGGQLVVAVEQGDCAANPPL